MLSGSRRERRIKTWVSVLFAATIVFFLGTVALVVGPESRSYALAVGGITIVGAIAVAVVVARAADRSRPHD